MSSKSLKTTILSTFGHGYRVNSGQYATSNGTILDVGITAEKYGRIGSVPVQKQLLLVLLGHHALAKRNKAITRDAAKDGLPTVHVANYLRTLDRELDKSTIVIVLTVYALLILTGRDLAAVSDPCINLVY